VTKKNERPVFSTSKSQPVANRKGVANGNAYQRGSGPFKLRLETKGRAGKAVTVIFNMPCDETEATAMMKEMQTKFGCGATFKNSVIELRGDCRDKIEAYFLAKGLKSVRVGGL
jgi:translation initiation factor 1